MAGRYVCLECGLEVSEKAQLVRHWDDEAHGPAAVLAIGLARARGEEPSGVPTEGEERRSARARVGNAVSQRRRLRVIDGGRR